MRRPSGRERVAQFEGKEMVEGLFEVEERTTGRCGRNWTLR